jgi:ABC-2 type transport system ATP-binding protein
VVAEGSPRELKRSVGGDAVQVTLRDPADAEGRGRAVLATEPYVHEVTAESDQLRLYVDDGGTDLPRVLRVLDDAGIPIRAVSLSEPSLDDVFFSQTGRSLRDAGPTNRAETEEVPA